MENKKKLSGEKKRKKETEIRVAPSNVPVNYVRVMKRLSKKIRVQPEKHEDARYVET